MWDVAKVREDIQSAFSKNSERDLLAILKDNSFLFYELVERKYTAQPIFREVSFGGKYKCDFAWLSDRSDYPKWTLVEVEKPDVKLFNKNGYPAQELQNGLEQIKSWIQYFSINTQEKRRIFGSDLVQFDYILIIGSKENWSTKKARDWRAQNSGSSGNARIQVRTTEVFERAVINLEEKPEEFFSFEENLKTYEFKKLEEYINDFEYLNWYR